MNNGGSAQSHSSTFLHTIADVAALTGMSTRTVKRWVETGKIDHIRLGDGPRPAIRISEAALQDYLRRSTKRADDNAPRRKPGRPRRDEVESSAA